MGNRNFNNIRKDCIKNSIVFLGYPHRRHRKTVPTDKTRRIKIENIKEKEINNLIKKEYGFKRLIS